MPKSVQISDSVAGLLSVLSTVQHNTVCLLMATCEAAYAAPFASSPFTVMRYSDDGWPHLIHYAAVQ